MNFEDIQCYNENKILNIKIVKKTLELKEQLINFKRRGKNYYFNPMSDLANEYKLDLDNDTEAFIDKLIDKSLNYLAKLENSETVSVITFNFMTKKLNLPFLLEDDFLGKKFKIDKVVKDLKKKYLLEKNKNNSIAILGIKISSESEYLLLGKESSLIINKTKKDYFLQQIKKQDGLEIIENKKIEEEVFSILKESVINSKELKNYQFFIIEGQIEFYDNSKNFRMTTQDKIVMEEIKNDPTSYLNLWNTYADFEKKISLKKVEDSGYFEIKSYKESKYKGKKVVEIILDRSEMFKEGDTLRVVDTNPQSLFENGYTVENENEFFSKNSYDCDVVVDKNSSNEIITILYSKYLDMKKAKYLFFSLKGNDAVFRRRERARDLISSNASGMPSLNLLIEGKLSAEKKYRKKYEALSLQTKKSLFSKYDPTPNQREAIEIALNTPDIALIQGPPGTGKTTIITAILQRLSELKKEVGNISGRNILTSFQHDAVTNATARIKILGLPAEKYGQKSGTDGQVLNNIFKQYISETLKKFYDENPELKELHEERELLELYATYSNLEFSPEKNQIKNLLKNIKKFAQNYGFLEILENIKQIEDELIFINKDYLLINKSPILKLPISEKMLNDNGRYFIKKSIDILEKGIANGELFKADFQLEIKFLKICLESEIIDFKRVKRCKTMIISKLTPVEDIYITSKSNKKIDEIFQKINNQIQEIKSTSKDNKERLKLKYIDELENNPLRVRDTLRSYITTFAATCQQTQGKAIREAKNREKVKINKNLKLEDYEKYENVLVDEAARSNPPDLLIPMSVATERIILVGDHKQLPHIVDENILEIMKNEENSVVDTMQSSEILKTSMFEVLSEKCKELEKADGIKRMVMLNTQYRMHPLMGEFISRHFYNNDLQSKLGADKFETKLKGLEGIALGWMDIPYSEENKEQNRNRSKYRSIEAKEIAKFIYKHIDSEEAKGKNFGVITFYSEQREEIFKELANPENRFHENQRLAVIKDGKRYKIADYYAISEEKGITEKLRVGSVDAFQGMEFNFVCLSMVRSNKNSNIIDKFGFLINPNRLCVSMSRQKDLIIVFGDSKMLEGKHIKDIEALQDFLRMCKEEGKYGKYKSIL